MGERVLAPNLLLLGVHRLDAIIVTHPDADHVNGLPAVIAAVPVKRLLDTGYAEGGTVYQQVVDICAQRRIPRITIRAGQRLNLGDGARLHILAPEATFLHNTAADTNNNSLVCLLEFGGTRMLFTGDLEHAGETALLARRYDLRADILTVAHHGSRNGTSDALLDAVCPKQAIISSRGDQFGQHPHPETLRRLSARDIRIWRTDLQGQIRLSSDGRQWQSTTFRR